MNFKETHYESTQSTPGAHNVAPAVWLLAVFWLGRRPPSSLAQSGRGTLTGSVRTPPAQVFPGASITLKETNTGSPMTTIAGVEGLFTFPDSHREPTRWSHLCRVSSLTRKSASR